MLHRLSVLFKRLAFFGAFLLGIMTLAALSYYDNMMTALGFDISILELDFNNFFVLMFQVEMFVTIFNLLILLLCLLVFWSIFNQDLNNIIGYIKNISVVQKILIKLEMVNHPSNIGLYAIKLISGFSLIVMFVLFLFGFIGLFGKQALNDIENKKQSGSTHMVVMQNPLDNHHQYVQGVFVARTKSGYIFYLKQKQRFVLIENRAIHSLEVL